MSADKPFAAIQSSKVFLETEVRRDVLAALAEGLGAREPFLLLTGESGTGKTALIREAVSRWGKRALVAFVANPALTRTELIEEIVRRFGVEPAAGASKPQLIASLEKLISDAADRKQTPVVVIDDAHDLDSGLLAELRHLANAMIRSKRTLEIILIGLPSLEARLEDEQFASLCQRIGERFKLSAFSQSQTQRYLHEIVCVATKQDTAMFPKKACREIFRRSNGVPRSINRLAADALETALELRADTVTPEHVRAAAGPEEVKAAPAPAPKSEPAPAPTKPSTPAPATSESATLRATQKHAPKPTPEGSNSSPEPRPSRSARPSATEPAAAADATPPQPKDWRETRLTDSPELRGTDYKVNEWVGRFISPEEPRFGSLVGSRSDEPAWSGEVWDGDGTSDDMDEETAAVLARIEARRRKLRRKGRPGSRAGIATVAVLGIVAVGALIVMPRSRAMITGMVGQVAASDAPKVEAPSDPEAEATEEPQAIRLESPQRAAAVKPARTPEPKPAAVEPEPAKAEPAPIKPVLHSNLAPPELQERQRSRSAPKPAPRRTTTAASTSVKISAPADARFLALDVGAHGDLTSAEIERERLIVETGLSGWILTRTRSGRTVYRVVLGIYSSIERAELSAGLLFERELIREAEVIPLPPRSERR